MRLIKNLNLKKIDHNWAKQCKAETIALMLYWIRKQTTYLSQISFWKHESKP